MRNALLLLVGLMFSTPCLADVSGFTSDLSIGEDLILASKKVVMDRMASERFEYGSFPGLKDFLSDDGTGFVPEACTRLAPQMTLLSKEFQPTGAGSGTVELLYVDTINCTWSYAKSKIFKIQIWFATENAAPEIESIVPLN